MPGVKLECLFLGGGEGIVSGIQDLILSLLRDHSWKFFGIESSLDNMQGKHLPHCVISSNS